MRLAARRVPMLVVGLLSMACGMWLGLVRLGWNLPLPWQDQLIAHGPLMVCGFLGTLISLERAVALGSRWGYAAPVLVASGALTLDLGPLGAFGPVRQHGVTRFMAVCLLGGYAWLGVGGAIATVTGVAMPGLLYDAMLHAVFIGFVISMVFAHAPIIFPAVLGVPLEYRPAFYLHVGVLHISLVLRVVGDLVDSLGRWRVWGGLLNAAALLLFMFNTGRSMALRGNHGDPI